MAQKPEVQMKASIQTGVLDSCLWTLAKEGEISWTVPFPFLTYNFHVTFYYVALASKHLLLSFISIVVEPRGPSQEPLLYKDCVNVHQKDPCPSKVYTEQLVLSKEI